MNVVFDLGGVVVEWQPDLLIARYFTDASERAAVRREVVDHPDWLALDRGTLPRENAIARGALRTGIDSARLEAFFLAMPPALVPMQDTISLMRQLRAKGVPLYCLSNMHIASIAYLEANHNFFELFSGKTISCRVQAIKPEAAIYQHLLSSCRLIPSDSVFIDDLQVNLDAAAVFGMRTIQFRDAAQCTAALRALRCL